MFVFVCLSLLFLLMSLFYLVSLPGQNIVSNDKDAAAVTAAVELNPRTTSVLLTLKIVHFSLELSVQ